MNASKYLVRTVRGLAAGCLVMAGVQSVSAEPLFTVNEGSVPGALPNMVTADRISFNYEANINQTIVGPFDGVGDTFVENGFLTKASYAIGGSAVSSQLNSIAPIGYGIYGLFQITGSAALNAAGGITATFATASLTLYIDPTQNSVLGYCPTVACVVSGGADDYAIANYSLLVGEAHVFPGLANGDFDSLLSFALTDNGTAQDGQSFFVNPNPFFNIENFGGNTQTITGASTTSSFVAHATGAGTELFLAVPEPGTLSIAGLALLGLGAFTRRQKKSA